MAVGANILDGGTAGKTGDFAHGFDASVILVAGVFNDIVPVFTAHDFDDVVATLCGNAAHTVDDNDAIEAFVVSESVGAVTEDESREMILAGKTIGVGNFVWAFDFDDIAGGTPEAHSG